MKRRILKKAGVLVFTAALTMASVPVSAVWGYEAEAETEKMDDAAVMNNGGRFVSYNGSVYYWRFAPGSISQTGVLGSFTQVEEVSNTLVCRNANGEETELIQDTGTGPLFISGGRIYYEKGYSSWGVCQLDGQPVTSYDSVNVLEALQQQEAVVAQDYSKGIFVIAADGSETVLAPAEASYIGVSDGSMYYGIAADNRMDVYCIGLDGGNQAAIGSIVMSQDYGNFEILSIGDVLMQDDGIYFTCGFYGGTGNFFSAGGIYRIGYDGSFSTLLDPSGPQQVNFPKIYIQQTDGASTLYYYSGDGYSNAGSWDGWVSENVYGMNLETGETAPSSFVLSDIGDIVCMDGSIQTLTDNSGQYKVVLSQEAGSSLGYTDIGGHSGNGETFVADLDLVDDTAYFTITKMTEDPSVSVGWRTGYSRDSMKTYMTRLGTDEVTLLNEY